MKLYYSDTSPYSRKVRLVIIEKGLTEQVEEQLINPFESNKKLTQLNPLGKIPVLVLDNGESLFDSPVICRYLDSLSSSQSILIPDNGMWQTLRWEALADGLTNATYNLVMERRRPVSEQSTTWIARWAKDISNSLVAMEIEINTIGEEITLAHLAVATSIAYIDLRFPTILYESACPQVTVYPGLLTWYEQFKTRSSMLDTQPKD